MGTVDLTYAQKLDGLSGETTNDTSGRVAFYADGKTQNGIRITASIDTGEGKLDEIFRDLGERDPRTLLTRIDPRDLYPTYGDDSTSEDRTPTAGKIYLRIEKDANYLQWGNFKSELGDNGYISNDRALYGLSAGLATRDLTTAGDARASLSAYAAQPDMLPQRDTFLGTGGTVFFLEKQDIALASEIISIQLRDPDTGRVVETRELAAGRDYEINYIQGIVTLARPLQSAINEGLFSDGATGTSDVVLVAQYEYRPDATDIDGFAYGGRVEGWVSDNLRLGVSAMKDETGATDHETIGGDVRFQVSEDSYLQLEYAQSKGTGFDSTFSPNGGLIVADEAAAGTSGTAVKLTARANMADIGLGADGVIGGYFEQRTEGFSTLGTQTTAATGDETFWGVYANTALSERITLGLELDSYENAIGTTDIDAVADLTFEANDQFTYAVGVEHQNRKGDADAGSRTDIAARITYAPDELRSIYAFGQATVARDGLAANNRYGAGGSYGFGNGWALAAEMSDGTAGIGGRVGAEYADDAGNTRYAAYEIDPTRSLNGITLSGRDKGRIVVGSSQEISGSVSAFGENAYDLFGRHKSLTAAYGLTYAPSDAFSVTSAFELGQVEDGSAYDFDRRAVSVGMLYSDDMINASGRLEYRIEDGISNGIDVTSDTFLFAGAIEYKIDEVQRVVIDADVARSDTTQGPLLDGNYADVVLGYAYRPIEDDRLNILARYRYLYDVFGLRDATEDDGPRQKSHVVSVDASYDLDRNWTIGGKLGYRSAQSAADGASAFNQNNAWLAVASARYHPVHDWDALLEVRSLGLEAANTTDTGVLGAVYKHLGNNLKVGAGYNFGRFSDDLTDLTYDDKGAFVNLVAKF